MVLLHSANYLLTLKYFAMEKRFFMILVFAIVAFGFTSCEYDDGDLWNKVNSLEQQVNANSEDIATLSALVDALNKGKVITSSEQTEDGYKLTFSDGSSVNVRNGEDGDSFFRSVEEVDGVVVITMADGRVIKIPTTYELRVLTFEDADVQFEEYNFTDDLQNEYTISNWSSLIPAEQYGDEMLYGSVADDYMGWSNYHWSDDNNTNIYSCTMGNEPVYWNGGQAVSDFYNADIEALTYMNQLEVATGKAGAAGHNGSKNFCVHNGDAGFEFKDGVERVIDHMYVTNTSYALSSLTYGDAFSTAAGADTWFKIVATGFDKLGAETGKAEFRLCDGADNIVKEWKRFDLTALGEVARVTFHLEGSADLCGEWGLNTPKYFAFDDVAVRFEK